MIIMMIWIMKIYNFKINRTFMNNNKICIKVKNRMNINSHNQNNNKTK